MGLMQAPHARIKSRADSSPIPQRGEGMAYPARFARAAFGVRKGRVRIFARTLHDVEGG